ncbi:hypothetical protein B4110_2672 [Parageobacillus toebii]|uniref:Uncharacterized protein n=1 Tax=Parageobacillus toebii TaxID=153151 RepID=A0A150N812_9BACL|nr:hypothetical protein B4110_2672 [Parageobacillus toebii]
MGQKILPHCCRNYRTVQNGEKAQLERKSKVAVSVFHEAVLPR